MNVSDKKRIVANWTDLVENLRVVELRDQLVSTEIIGVEEDETIFLFEKTSYERVRILLRTLMRKSDPLVLQNFCEILRDSDVYGYLANSIQNCDISNVREEDCDEVDSENASAQKEAKLIESLLRQNDEFIRMRRQIDELTEKNEILQRRSSIMSTLEQNGFTEKSLVQFIDVFVVAKNVIPPSTPTTNNGSMPDIVQNMSLNSLSADQRKGCLLAIDIVRHVVAVKCATVNVIPSSFQQCADELRERVDIVIRQHNELFNGAIQNMHSVEFIGYNTFKAIADELFANDVCNWGRVIAWLAFCASLAKKFPADTSVDSLDMYAVYSWYFIDQRMCDWINKSGGWDAFLKYLVPRWSLWNVVGMSVNFALEVWRLLP